MVLEKYSNERERNLRCELESLAEKVFNAEKKLRENPNDMDAKTVMKALTNEMERKVFGLYLENPSCNFYTKFLSENHSIPRKERANPEMKVKKEKSNIIKRAIRHAKAKVNGMQEENEG